MCMLRSEMAEGAEVLSPVVSRLKPENALKTFTDYSQWERRPSKGSGLLETSLPKLTIKSKTQLTGAPSATLQPVCKHGKGSMKHSFTVQPAVTRSKLRPTSTRGEKQRRPKTKESSSVQLLRLQVAAKKSSVEDYKKYKEELFQSNLSIIAAIEKAEEKTHGSVNELLEKYQKFKGAISTLKEKSAGILKSATEDLQATRRRLQEEIKILREQVSSTDASLQSKSRQLQTLFHYKDKEYPIRIVHVEQLKEQMELLSERNEGEILELESEIAEERRRCDQQLEEMRMNMEARAAKISLTGMKRSIQQKAIQNKIMKKEILIHKEKRVELEHEVQTLKSNIRHLKQSMRKNSRRQLYPRGKCLPDTEFHLNIPVLEHLPV